MCANFVLKYASILHLNFFHCLYLIDCPWQEGAYKLKKKKKGLSYPYSFKPYPSVAFLILHFQQIVSFCDAISRIHNLIIKRVTFKLYQIEIIIWPHYKTYYFLHDSAVT